MSQGKTTTILMCRHGETDWNKRRKFQGSVDIPLNENGREQAARIAATMSSRGLTAIWTSPLLRAHCTAQVIADTCRVALRLDDRLRERHLGIIQGVGYRKVKETYKDIWAAWKGFQSLPPEAKAEPDEDVTRRLEEAFFDIAAEHPGGTVAVVGHGGTMRCLLREAGSVGNASVTTFVVGPGRSWRLVGVDDEGHLPKPSLKLGDLSDPDEPRSLQGIPVTTVVLCRHGESVGNEARIFQGLLDMPLSETGRLQARLMGCSLAPLDVAALWTSPLARARDTAREISALIGVEVKEDARLMERNLGKLQGMSFEEVKRLWPKTWQAWRGYLPLPEEMGAEPRPDVVGRLESVFFELAQLYPGRTVAVVIHGANGRCLLKRSIGNASLTEIQVGPGREWHVKKVGDASHLPTELAADAIRASKL